MPLIQDYQRAQVESELDMAKNKITAITKRIELRKWDLHLMHETEYISRD